MLAGAIKPTSGEIYVRGKPSANWNAARSRSAGIETVFQDRALCVQQSIVRNIFIGREITNVFGFLDRSRERSEAERLMREIGFTSKVFTPRLDRRPALRRRATGGRDRPRHLQQGGPDHHGRADDRAVADRDGEGVPLRARRCAQAAVRSCSSATTSTTSTTSPSASSCMDRGTGRAAGDQGGGRSAERLIAFMERLAHPQGVEIPPAHGPETEAA